MEKEQQQWFRKHRLVQRKQQYDELGGLERRINRIARAKSVNNFTGSALKTHPTKKSRGTCPNECGLAGFVPLNHGTGDTRIRYPQAQIQILLVLRSESENGRGQD